MLKKKKKLDKRSFIVGYLLRAGMTGRDEDEQYAIAVEAEEAFKFAVRRKKE